MFFASIHPRVNGTFIDLYTPGIAVAATASAALVIVAVVDVTGANDEFAGAVLPGPGPAPPENMLPTAVLTEAC